MHHKRSLPTAAVIRAYKGALDRVGPSEEGDRSS
jgi:hypothetical protein